MYCRKLLGSARRGAGIAFLCLLLSFLMLSSCVSTMLCLKQCPLNITPTSVGLSGHISPCGWSSLCCTISGWKALSLTSLMCKHAHTRFFYLSMGYNNQNLAVPPKQGDRTTQSGFLSWSSINALYHQGSGTSVVLCL